MSPPLAPPSPLLHPRPRILCAAPSPRADLDAIARRAGLSERDRRILALTLRKLDGAAPDFDEALRALREAVEELIPAGRTFFLGALGGGPIVGSILSGVGIAAGPEGVLLLRVDRLGGRAELGSLAP